MNTTAIAYTKILRLRPTFCMYAIAVVFTNVRELRVIGGGMGGGGREGEEKKNPSGWQTRRDSARLRNWLTHGLREYSTGKLCMY